MRNTLNGSNIVTLFKNFFLSQTKKLTTNDRALLFGILFIIIGANSEVTQFV